MLLVAEDLVGVVDKETRLRNLVRVDVAVLVRQVDNTHLHVLILLRDESGTFFVCAKADPSEARGREQILSLCLIRLALNLLFYHFRLTVLNIFTPEPNPVVMDNESLFLSC